MHTVGVNPLVAVEVTIRLKNSLQVDVTYSKVYVILIPTLCQKWPIRGTPLLFMAVTTTPIRNRDQNELTRLSSKMLQLNFCVFPSAGSMPTSDRLGRHYT